MKPDSVSDLIVRIQKILQSWDWSLAISGVLEVRDEHDRFIASGSVPEIATVLRQEASYRAYQNI